MELQFYGANCLRITTKKGSLIIDDNLADLGLKTVTKAGDTALFTYAANQHPKDVKLIIDQPGEYEISDTSVQGVAARGHMDEANLQAATIYKIEAEEIRVVVTGHIYPELNDQQLEALGTVDVLILPIGGNGYTLDPIGALKIIKKIEPKLIIPTHYADSAINYQVPQQELEAALKELSMEPKETVTKLKLKSSDLVSDVAQLIILERQG